MPDNNGGVLGGIGGLLGRLGATMGGPIGGGMQDVAGVLSPEAFQQNMYLQQLHQVMAQNPGMSLNEALYRMSPAGQTQQYGYNKLGEMGVGGPNGITGMPIIQHGGNISYGFPGAPNNPQPVGQTAQPPTTPSGTNQPIATQTQGGPETNPLAGTPIAGLGPLVSAGQRVAASGAGATKTAETEATAKPGFQGALTQAQNAVRVLQGIDQDSGLGDVVGGALGWRGRLTPDIGGHRADTINSINTAQGKLLADTFTGIRAVSGRPVSPGAIKELVAGLGDLQGDRYGTLPAFHGDVKRIIQQISDETDAAWQASGKPSGYEPGSIAKTAFAPQSSGPPRIASDQEHAKLKSGAQYFAPDGSLRTKR